MRVLKYGAVNREVKCDKNHWHVFIVVDFLDRHGGVGKSLSLVARLLHQAGHDVSVFVEEPVPADNQYAQVLKESSIPILSPHPAFAWLRRQCEIGNLLLTLLAPIRLALSVVDMLIRGRSFRRAWVGVRGWLNWYVPHKEIVRPTRWVLYGLLTHHFLTSRPSLVHVARGVAGLRWASRFSVPSVFVEASVPGPDLALNWWNDLKNDLWRADLVIAVCSQGEQGVRDYCGYGGPIAVVPWIVEEPYPNGMESLETMFSGKTYIVGTAGRLNREKGQAWLIRAIPQVIQHSQSPVEFWFAGDGPDRPKLERLATELGVKDVIRFLGHQDKAGMARFWKGIDLFVLPSLLEAVPLVLIEAMACIKPIVATDVGGVRELLDSGRCGVLVSPQDAGALAQAILQVLNDPLQARAMAKAGRGRFEERHAPQAAFPMWLRVYDQVIVSHEDRKLFLP